MKPASMWFCWWQWKSVEPGIVGHELNIHLGVRVHQHRIFYDAVHFRMAGQSAQLEAVAVQMNRMIVGAVVDEGKTIPLAGGQCGAGGFRVGLTVDGPMIHGPVAGKFGGEDQRDHSGRIGVRWSQPRQSADSPRRVRQAAPIVAFRRFPRIRQ